MDLVVGADGRARCGWAVGAPDYEAYHDDEWGRPVHGDNAIFERITLEAFQSGLSWLTILRKRPSFRRAFADFEIRSVAAFGESRADRLMQDASIVRNRRKIEAAITNARALSRLLDERGQGALDALVWSHRPPSAPRPRPGEALPATSAASIALSRALKGHGLVFVGPTTMHALLQACGIVDEHLAGCWVPSGARRS